jgi:hypothetical protein
VGKMKTYHEESRREEIPYKQLNEGRLTVLVTCCVGTAFLNTSLTVDKRKIIRDGKRRKKK